MTFYNIGTGIADVTDPAIGLKLQGMADPFQESHGVESRLYARAFIVVDRESGERVVIVSADIWTGTQAVKTEVINRLDASPKHKGYYKHDNVLISGTHTHSGPGGYSGNRLYDDNCGGFDQHNFECIVSGMFKAISNAQENLAPGKIYINSGSFSKTKPCGSQRSFGAFENNYEYKQMLLLNEDNDSVSPTDREMLLLKFVVWDKAGELPIGMISWYPIHPTDRGQANRFVSGDNKGEASRLFEEMMKTDYVAKDTFVAAFANSNCGDVSGNVFTGVPTLITANDGTDKKHMENHGKMQFDKAKALFDTALTELSGSVEYRHTRVDMANILLPGWKKTYPAALGLSFAAGSSEDSIPIPPTGLKEGITKNNISFTEKEFKKTVKDALEDHFGKTTMSRTDKAGHSPKPIVLAPGLFTPPIVPNILPIQILKIGNLVITGVPGELTTMAGRRLRNTVLGELEGSGVDHLALATYANDYSQYITTEEEYEMQHYEGASTLFGPHTLAAYQQIFKSIASALKDDKAILEGPKAQEKTSPNMRRITIRNLTKDDYNIYFHMNNDFFPSFTLVIKKYSDTAWLLPSGWAMAKIAIPFKAEISSVTPDNSKRSLVTISSAGQTKVKMTASMYAPPAPEQPNKSTIGRKGPAPIPPAQNNSWLEPVIHMMNS